MLNDPLAWAAFFDVKIKQPKKIITELLQEFTTVESVLHAPLTELRQIIPTDVIKHITQKHFIHHTTTIVQKYLHENIKALTHHTPEYPKIWHQLKPSAPLIFYRGNKSLLCQQNHHYISIVGTRKASDYGKLTTNKIIQALPQFPIITISGLALGIDSCVHTQSIQNKIPTIAILGTPLQWSQLYPRQNIRLAQKIINHGGLILSEYPHNHITKHYNFLERNRLIASLGYLTIVTEAASKSGALHTARQALHYNNDVMVIPHDIQRESGIGCNLLLRDGALLYTCPEDIYINLGYTKKSYAQPKIPIMNNVPEKHKALCHIIQQSPRSLDDLLEFDTHSMHELLIILTELELNGYIYKNNHDHYVYGQLP